MYLNYFGGNKQSVIAHGGTVNFLLQFRVTKIVPFGAPLCARLNFVQMKDQSIIILAYLSFFSSLRSTWPYGLSPGGLPSDGYLGHTFWDQATWMYPPLLLFHQDLARSCLEYRYNRIDAAEQRAKNNGYKGIDLS